jgi:hypothetical protein
MKNRENESIRETVGILEERARVLDGRIGLYSRNLSMPPCSEES